MSNDIAFKYVLGGSVQNFAIHDLTSFIYKNDEVTEAFVSDTAEGNCSGEDKWTLEEITLEECSELDGTSAICSNFEYTADSWRVHNPTDGQFKVEFNPLADQEFPTSQGIYTAKMRWVSS